MGDDDPRCTGSGARSAARSRLKTCPATSSSNSVRVTEDLNRRWYERNTGQAIRDVQRRVQHPVIGWMAATLDGIVEGTGAVFESQIHAALDFPGRRPRPKSTWRSCGTICGWRPPNRQRC
jgi:hypothetical protein